MARSKVYLIPDKAMNHTVSHLRGVRNEVRGEGRQIEAVAQSRLVPHRNTGRAKIEMEMEDTDAIVSLVDEAALSIEFGHYLGNSSQGTDRQFVRGLHLFLEWYHDGIA